MPVHIDRSLRADLRALCQLEQTTVAMGALTAFAAIALRWCNASEGVIQCVVDGRPGPNLSGTIGFFASLIFLHVRLSPQDTPAGLLSQVQSEYCHAYRHLDYGYTYARQPRPGFASSPSFNWLPQLSTAEATQAQEGGGHDLDATPYSFVHPMISRMEMDNDPSTLLYDSEDEVVGGMYFPVRRFAAATMQRFTHDYLSFLRSMVSDPDWRICNLPIHR